MYSIVFDSIPAFVERKKSQAPDETALFGSSVARDEMLRAFHRYGTAEHQVFFMRDLKRDLIDAHVELGRTKVLSPGSLAELRDLHNVILFSPFPVPHALTPVRRVMGRKWPIVTVSHAMSDLVGVNLSVQLLSRESMPYDAVISSSCASRRALEKLVSSTAEAMSSPERGARCHLRVIPLGVDCASYCQDRDSARKSLQIPEDAIVLLYFGRLTPFAKADLGPLLLSFREILRENENVLLVISGDDTRHKMSVSLCEYAAQFGITALRVMADVDAITKRQLFASADVFVAPSDHIQESFGIALIEAMAAGLPVVASDWSAFREIVLDSQTGFLAPTYWTDSEGRFELTSIPAEMEQRNTFLAQSTVVDCRALSASLSALIRNRELRKSFGAKAREIARQKYDWQVIVKAYESVFDDLNREAAISDRQEPPSGPFSYDVQRIFSHFVSAPVPRSAILRVSIRGQEWLQAHFPLTTISEPMVSCETIEQVLSAVEAAASLTFGECIARAHDHDALVGGWIVGRLIKYGLLEMDTPPENGLGASADRGA
jgi:glycosyltransferase involved in cell wall biosynthesis